MGTFCLRRMLAPWCPQLPRAPCEQLLPPVSAYSTGLRDPTTPSLSGHRSSARILGKTGLGFAKSSIEKEGPTPRPPASKIDATLPLLAVEPNAGPTGDSLRSLQSVKNIRDLSEACGNIAPGRIFRSACPVAAVVEDVETLRDRLRVKHMIDLRSDYERDQDLPLSEGLLSRAVYRRNSKRGSSIETQIENALGRSSGEGASMQIDLLSLLERERYYKAMLTRLPYQTAASLLFWGLFNQSYAKTLAIQEINKAGLPGLYEIILETAGTEIKHALEVIIECAEAETPVLYFCKLGKDRTGLLTTLILTCCGASSNEIVSDYARSDGVDEVALGGMEKDKELQQLDRTLFSRAPPEVMQKTLAHLQGRYGGAKGYLDSIGFSQQQQERLARSLAPGDD